MLASLPDSVVNGILIGSIVVFLFFIVPSAGTLFGWVWWMTKGFFKGSKMLYAGMKRLEDEGMGRRNSSLVGQAGKYVGKKVGSKVKDKVKNKAKNKITKATKNQVPGIDKMVKEGEVGGEGKVKTDSRKSEGLVRARGLKEDDMKGMKRASAIRKGGGRPGAPSRGGPKRGGPSRGGPSRGGPSRGGPSRGEPSGEDLSGGDSEGGMSDMEETTESGGGQEEGLGGVGMGRVEGSSLEVPDPEGGPSDPGDPELEEISEESDSGKGQMSGGRDEPEREDPNREEPTKEEEEGERAVEKDEKIAEDGKEKDEDVEVVASAGARSEYQGGQKEKMRDALKESIEKDAIKDVSPMNTPSKREQFMDKAKEVGEKALEKGKDWTLKGMVASGKIAVTAGSQGVKEVGKKTAEEMKRKGEMEEDDHLDE